MKKLAKILVLVLSVALVFGAIAFAIGAESGPAYGYYTAEGAELSLTESLADAFAGAYDGTVILQENIEISESLVIPEGKTFDLGNKKITNTANVFVFSLEGTAKITGEGHIQTVGGVITSTAGATLSGTGSGIYVKAQATQLFNVASDTLTLELCDIYTDGQDDANEQIELNGGANLSMNNVKYVVNNVTANRTHMFNVGDGSTVQRVNISNSTIDSTTLFVSVGGHENYITVTDSYLDFTNEANPLHPCTGSGSPSGKLLLENSTYAGDFSAFYLGFGSASKTTYVVEASNSTLMAMSTNVYSFFRGNFTVNLKNNTKIYCAKAGCVWQHNGSPTVNAEAGTKFNMNPKPGMNYPEGYSIYRNWEYPNGDTSYPFTYEVSQAVKGASAAHDFSNQAENLDNPSTAGMTNVNGYGTYSYLPDGETIGWTYHLPTFVEDGNGGYTYADGITGTNWNSGTKYPPLEYIPGVDGADGQIVLKHKGTYMNLPAGNKIVDQPSTGGGIKASEWNVLTYRFGLYADATYGMPDLTVQLVGKGSNGKPTEGNAILIKSNSAVLCANETKSIAIEPGVVNCFDIVVNIDASKAYIFVNGELLGSFSGGAVNAANRQLDSTLRCRISGGTYNENASFSFVSSSGLAYGEYIGGKFNATDYLPYGIPTDINATVNGVVQNDLADAFLLADKLGSIVTLTGNIEGNVTLPNDVGGVIVTNGYSVNISSNLTVMSYADAAGNTVYYIANPLDVNWNYIGGVVNDKYESGKTPVAPVISNAGAEMFGKALVISGWALVEIDPADYASYEEYKAAADAVKLTGFNAVTNAELSAGLAREYYAVYEASDVVAKVTGADGSTKLLVTLSDFVMYMQDDYNGLMVNGDTVKLMADVAVTKNIEGANGVPFNIRADKAITLDLNGHTIDFGESGGQFTVGAMNKVNGVNAYTHGKVAGLNVLSSAPGAKILSKSNAAIFQVNGAYKTFNYNGENIYLEGMRFLETLAQGASTADGRNSSINVNGGTFKQLAGSQHSFFRHYGGSIAYVATVNVSNAVFTADPNTTFLLRVDGTGIAYKEDTETKVRDAIVFNNCDFTLSSEASRILYSYSHNSLRVVFNGCDIVGAPVPHGGYGKVVLGEGTTITSYASTVKEYDAEALANATLDEAYVGTYLGASDLALGRLGENKWQVVKASELVEYSFVEPNGDAIGTEKYISGTAPYYAGKNHNEYKTLTLVFNGWAAHESEANTYVAQYTVGGKGFETQVSAFLYTELGVNLYIPADVAALLAEGSSEFVDAGDGYFRATVSVPANLAFSGASFTLKFNEETIAGVKSVSYSTSVPVVQYAAMILGGEFSENEKDLMYYMLTYLDAAYKYMTISEAETAAIAKFGFENAASAFAVAIGEYQPVTAREGEAAEYTGVALGLNISVDLQASPVFVIETENEAIAKVVINGIQVVDGKFEIGNVYNFDRTLNITTYNAEGEVLTSGTFCYANYLYAAENSGDATVAAVADALYSYILAAKAFGNK